MISTMARSVKLSKTLQHRLILGAAAISAAALAAGVLLQDVLFRWSIQPSAAFNAASAPPQPDYATPEAWAVRPAKMPPGAWESPWGVDVFFIHPTTAYSGKSWNAPVDAAPARARLDDHTLPNFAAPLEAGGPVYAPLYRQAALAATLDSSGGSARALELAYTDVLRAFDHYAATANRGRGVIVVGVGQGGMHALRLVADRFQDEPMKERLAAAYVIDAVVPADLVSLGLSQPACAGPADIHCIAAWTAVFAGDSGARKQILTGASYWKAGALAQLDGDAALCMNPLLWSVSEALAPRTDHRGGARVMSADAAPRIIPEAITARCSGGVLEIERPSEPELRPATTWGARYKTADFNLFYADIQFNAAERAREASVWLEVNGRRPAKPLPPPMALHDEPIHRPGGVIDPVQ